MAEILAGVILFGFLGLAAARLFFLLLPLMVGVLMLGFAGWVLCYHLPLVLLVTVPVVAYETVRVRTWAYRKPSR